MNNSKLKLVFILCLVFLLVKCSGDDNNVNRTPYTNFYVKYFSNDIGKDSVLQSRGDSLELGIETNSYWALDEVPKSDWVSFSARKGTGDKDVTIQIAANDSVGVRSTWVKLEAFEFKDSIKISQRGLDFFIAQNSFRVSADTSTIKTTVEASDKWEVVKNDISWLKVTPEKGDKGQYELDVFVLPNERDSVRIDSIAFQLSGSEGNPKYWLKIVQEGKIPVQDYLILTDSVIKISADETQSKMSLSTNIEWKAIAPKDIAVEPDHGKAGDDQEIILKFPENELDDGISYDIKFIGVEQDTISRTLRIEQKGALELPYLTLKDSIVEVENTKGKIQLSLSSNIDWESGASDEVKISPSEGSSGEDQEITIEYPENQTEKVKTYSVQFFGKDDDKIKRTFVIKQKVEKPSFVIENEKVVIDGRNQLFDITMNSAEVDWEAVSESSRFTIVSGASGSASDDPAIIQVNAGENKTPKEIEGTIRIREVGNPDNNIEVSITQILHPVNDETSVYSDPDKTISQLHIYQGDTHPTQDGWRFWTAHEFSKNAGGFYNFTTKKGLEKATFDGNMKVVENGKLKIKTRKLGAPEQNQFGETVEYATSPLYSLRYNLQGGPKWVKFTQDMRIEVRYRTSGHSGFNNAVWFMGVSNYDSQAIPWPANGEIDLIEMPQLNRNEMTLHTENFSSETGNSTTAQQEVLDEKEWNIYWVEIHRDKITGGINGQQYFEHHKGDNGNNDWPWDNDAGMQMIITPGIGANGAGMPNLAPEEEAFMELDWIRVYVDDQFDESSQSGFDPSLFVGD